MKEVCEMKAFELFEFCFTSLRQKRLYCCPQTRKAVAKVSLHGSSTENTEMLIPRSVFTRAFLLRFPKAHGFYFSELETLCRDPVSAGTCIPVLTAIAEGYYEQLQEPHFAPEYDEPFDLGTYTMAKIFAAYCVHRVMEKKS